MGSGIRMVPSAPNSSSRERSTGWTSQVAVNETRAPETKRSTPSTWVATSTAMRSPRRAALPTTRSSKPRPAIATTASTGPSRLTSAVM